MPFWKNRPKIFGGRKEAPTPIDTVAVQAVNNKTAPQMLEEGVKTSIRHPRQTAAPTLELPAIKIKTLARVEIDYLEEEGEREPEEEAREEDPATQIDIRPSKKNKRVLTEQERAMVFLQTQEVGDATCLLPAITRQPFSLALLYHRSL